MAQKEMLDTSFMQTGACVGLSSVMFPPLEVTGKQRGIAYQHAQEICADCPVRAECLEWALMDPYPIEGGVVAGLTPSQLAEARKDRVTERRANYTPKCGGERGYAWHLERGETCSTCIEAHNRKGQRYGEAVA